MTILKDRRYLSSSNFTLVQDRFPERVAPTDLHIMTIWAGLAKGAKAT